MLGIDERMDVFLAFLITNFEMMSEKSNFRTSAPCGALGP